jgi:hypothetical protein
MSAPEINALLEQWRQLTLHESVALRGQDWVGVRACQEAKATLQSQINLLPGNPAANPKVRQFATELVALENENSRYLTGQMQSLQAARRELDGSARNLQRVRHSYCQSNAGNWQSYG